MTCFVAALLYVVTARVGQIFALPPGNITPVWLPSGLLFVFALRKGSWIWPGIFIGAGLGNAWAYWASVPTSSAIFAATCNGMGDSLAIAGGAWVFRRLSGGAVLGSSRSFLVLLGVACAGSVVSAVLGITSLATIGQVPWSGAAFAGLTWMVGDGVGVLALAPPLMELAEPRAVDAFGTRGRWLLVPALVACVLTLVLPSTSVALPLVGLSAWSAMFLGRRWTYGLLLAMTTLLVVATGIGVGPFRVSESLPGTVLELQQVLALVSMVGVGLASVSFDRRLALRELAERNRDLEELERLFELSELALLVVDPAGRIARLNPAAERFGGLGGVLTTGQALSEWCPEHADEIVALANAASSDIEGIAGAVRITKLYGGVRGDDSYLLLRDVADERLAERLEVVGQLAGGVAHEFNNLLQIIDGRSYLLGLELSEALLPHLRGIEKASARASDLVGSLLMFAKRRSASPATLDPNATVRSIAEGFAAEIPSAIQLELELGNLEGACVHVDPKHLEDSLRHMLRNAFDALGGAGGRVSVSTRRSDESGTDRVHMAVLDTGVGMSRDVQERAFDPFFTSKGRAIASGLGLAVVYGFARSAGGAVVLESTPGEGTLITLSLPTSQTLATESVKPPSEASEVPVLSVLVVEDERDVLELVASVLTLNGYRVDTASNGREALELVSTLDRLDVLVSDVVLPGLAGPQLADRLRESFPDLRVLFMSGHAFDHLPTLTEPLLAKPFRVSELIEKLTELTRTT
jgi:two-component system cell cycle sensor histidine kinase/response regulator CckA